jgi:uncharacterized protein (TIGR03437 family)
VVNAASNTGQAQPNGGIAQGAIFVAYGTGLGPTPIAISPTPFQGLGVGGVSIKITVNRQTVECPDVLRSAAQAAALVPSSSPVGTGTFTITFNGDTSAAR